MISREDLPPTPDWLPESRCGLGCPESAVPVSITLREPLEEAMRLWDQDWSHWSGDDG